ncbi:hypothetical protein LIER_13334 [Lithospermum erythrorhizon]|uniref:CASP-like protein n=1 Tax=Lithospermum erythrorhizon TaxID=34254 RepID=A0AAV3PWJ6_LITER
MTPPPSTIVPPVVSLAVRVLTLICLFISIIILTTNTKTFEFTDYSSYKIKFNDYEAYKYLLATTVIGLVYTLLQTVLSVLQVASGNRLGGDIRFHIDFFADKIISTLLATGAAASFGMTLELKENFDDYEMHTFKNKSNAAASLCLIAFVFGAISSTISAYSLPKRA